MPPSAPRCMYVEDEDDQEGVRTYASTAPPGHQRTRPNSGKSREHVGESAITDSSSDPSDSDPEPSPTTRTAHEKLREAKERDRNAQLDRRAREAAEKEQKRLNKLRSKEQERKLRAEPAPRSGKDPKLPKKSRPPLYPAQTQPIINHYHDPYGRPPVDAPYYGGVQQPGAPTRPGARRPNSYYSGQPMPQPIRQTSHAASNWQQDPIVGTFPPPMFPPSPMMHHRPGGPPHGPPPSNDYFVGSPDDRERLRQRFNRPSSAMGGKSSMGYEHSQYDRPPMRPLHGRQPSQSGRPNVDRDRHDMPPPSFIPPRRTSSAMPSTSGSIYRPPPGPPPPSRQQRPAVSQRRSIGYPEPQFDLEDDDYSTHDTGLFHDTPPHASQDRSRGHKNRNRRESMGGDYSGDYQLAPASSGRRSARSSMYGYPPVDHDEYDGEGARLEDAERYMQLAGGSKTPLTENLLREANKRSGVLSSRSTHSSASRDDSDYRRSNATGPTTQYSDTVGESEAYTVRLPKGAKFTSANGFHVELPEAGEITVSRNRDRSMSEIEIPARPQIEDVQRDFSHRALEYRTRAPSTSGSLRREYEPRWGPSSQHAPYDPSLSAGNAF